MKTCFLILIALFLCHPTQAEIISLKSGEVIHGAISKEHDDYIQVENRWGIPLTYYRESIESIEPDPVIVPEIVPDVVEEQDLKDFVVEERRGVYLKKDKEEGLLGDFNHVHGEVHADELVNTSNPQDTNAWAIEVLRMLSMAAEFYAQDQGGIYPDDIALLTDSEKVYIARNYCDTTENGYEFSCKLGDKSYLFTAAPVDKNRTNATTFMVTTKGSLSVQRHGVKDLHDPSKEVNIISKKPTLNFYHMLRQIESPY